MKQSQINILYGSLLLVAIFVFVKFVPTNNYGDFSIKGITTNHCKEYCNYEISVKNIYTGSDVESSSDAGYSGIVSPKLCISEEMGSKCFVADVSNLSDYVFSTTTIDSKEQSFPNYSYIGKYVISNYKQKVYFLYRIWKPSDKWVQDNTLKMVSYDQRTKSVNDEGRVDINDIVVQDIQISPLGTTILIVDGDNPRYLPSTNTSGVTAYDLDKKTTKNIISATNGNSIKFVSWIDDTHFFYRIDEFSKMGQTIFKIGVIR